MKEEIFQSNSCHFWITDDRFDKIRLEIKVKEICFSGKSPFQKIEVFDTYEFGKVLVLGGVIVLAEKDEYIYHEMISHVPLFSHSKPENILVIGGGDGGVVREVIKHKDVKQITVVEIDKMVVEVSKKYFPALSSGLGDKRLKIIYNDGSKYINEIKEKFDIILVDSYDPIGTMQHLTGKDFFEDLFDHLTDDGIMVTPSQSPITNYNLVKKAYKSLSNIFPINKLYLSYLPSSPFGMMSFIICSRKYDPIKNITNEKSTNFAAKYYNTDIHKASFSLPNFIRETMPEGEKS
jgi:spermidine synthase